MTSQDLSFEDDDDEYEDSSSVNAFTPMHFSTAQRKVKDLLADYASKDLDPRPAFQRGYVWDKARASKLVESILLNVPLPLVYTAEEANKREVVIDGQQRLLSVFSYIAGEFPRDDSVFALSGLKLLKHLNGLTFKSLSETEQRTIQQYKFQIISISNESHADVKFEIFERINSGSVTLNAQELRNCVYRGRFNDFLRKLADNKDFRELIGASEAHGRMQDVELVLRYLAFYERTYFHYTGSMKSFLNEFMDEYRNLSEEKAANFESAFKQAVDLSRTVFGKQAFKKFSVGKPAAQNGGWERTINRPLFDIVMWGFNRFDKSSIVKNADSIREALILEMTSSPTFLDTITTAVGDKAKTQYRFEIWHDILKSILQGQSNPRLFDSSLRRQMFNESPVCSICSQAIQLFDDCHVDHIVPFSKGGPTVRENAQLTHRFCNLQKGSTVQGPG